MFKKLKKGCRWTYFCLRSWLYWKVFRRSCIARISDEFYVAARSVRRHKTKTYLLNRIAKIICLVAGHDKIINESAFSIDEEGHHTTYPTEVCTRCNHLFGIHLYKKPPEECA